MGITFNDGTQAMGANAQPITADDLGDYLRLADAQDDHADLIDDCIAAATRAFERLTNRTVMSQSRVLKLDDFPHAKSDNIIRLPKGPVTAVTKIEYQDESGEWQTMDDGDYLNDLDSLPPRVAPTAGSWPITQHGMATVKITYMAGAASPDDVPADVKNAITMLAAHYFTHPEGFAAVDLHAVPMAVQTVIDLYKLPEAIYA